MCIYIKTSTFDSSRLDTSTITRKTETFCPFIVYAILNANMADCCKYKPISVLIVLTCHVVCTESQLIHRSVSHSDYQHKYENQNAHFFSSWMLKEKAEGFLNCALAFQSYEATIRIASVISIYN